MTENSSPRLNVLKRWRMMAEASQEELSSVSTYTNSKGKLRPVDTATISYLENDLQPARPTTIRALVKGLNILFERKQLREREDGPLYHVEIEDLWSLTAGGKKGKKLNKADEETPEPPAPRRRSKPSQVQESETTE